MKYTVKVNKVRKNEGSLRGFATIVFGESFKVTNIAILENSNGNLFVSMPRYRSSEVDEQNNHIFKDVCNPITKEFREELYNAILDGYEKDGRDGLRNSKTEKKLHWLKKERSLQKKWDFTVSSSSAFLNSGQH